LRTEIKHLYEQEKEIKEQFNQLSEPGVIQNGVDIYIVEFGALSKKELDSVRKKVISTIPGHHFLKSGNQSIVVDFAEALENIDYNLISDKLNKVLMKNGPSPGRFYEIFQKKLSGKEIVFRGIIESVNGEEITIKRKMYAGGKLDGLGGEIKFGDYALTKFKPNSWIIEHNYFDKNGYSKGKYFNINTPVETYPNFARYIDLEIDVIEKAGKKEIIDTEKLERVTNEKMIKGELAQRAVEIANQIVKGEQK
jgi:predicted RNA-binding protein associated with RNAse of E/G family